MLRAMRRLQALAAATALSALALAGGCGGGSDPGSELAGVASPAAKLFVEGSVRPSGELKANTDSVAQTVAHVDSLGDFVVEKLEEEARNEGEPFDFEKEVEPWLGESAALAWENGDDDEPLIAVESTDTAATQEFIDHQASQSDEPYEDGSYEGVDFKVGGKDDNAVGVIGDLLVVAEDEQGFKAAVDASSGDSLADDDRFQSAMDGATEGSLADLYVDVGGLIKESGDEIDPQARQLLDSAGIDPSEATAVASVVPGSDRVEVDVSSELGGEEAPSGDASELLGSMPAGSFAAFALSGFGEQLNEAIDSLDRAGVPGEIPPGQLKSGLKQAGIDLEKIASSLGDAAVFAEGRGESSLGGALVLTSDDPGQAKETVSNIGSLLRASGSSGISAISGRASGFSISDEELGRQPLVVVSAGNRIAIGYGAKPTLKGVSESGPKLAGSSAYREAVEALGGTPISAFVDGKGALALARALVPKSDSGFREAVPYLRRIASVAVGSDSEGEQATAKLIVGLK
jgi:hypothetical protein